MQKIFYGGKIVTNNSDGDIVQAVLVNDGNVVLTGTNEEVLNLKTDDTKLENLKNKYVFPTLFSFKENIFEKIDKKIKNAKKVNNFQNFNEIDENYENFANFDEYKIEYFKIEKDILSRGITTVFEFGLDGRAFAFWKRMAREKLLKIEIVGYVDIVQSKKVMDDNCVTYRNSKNGFRLGGYNIKLDGELGQCRACLSKPYCGTKNYSGSLEIYGEQLYYMVKSALEERKQLCFFAEGDKSIREILTIFEEIEKKEKIAEFYRPLIIGSGFVPNCYFEKLKHFDFGLIIKCYDDRTEKKIKSTLGFFRKKHFLNYKELLSEDIKFSLIFDDVQYNPLNLSLLKKRKTVPKNLKKCKNSLNFENFLKNIVYFNPTYFAFDQDKKATIEIEKQAKFLLSEFNFLTDEIAPNFKVEVVQNEDTID